MPNKILLKRSSVVGKLPQPSDLDYGELSINYADGILFHKNSSNYVTTVNATIANGNVNAVAFLNNANTLVTSAALIYNPTTGNLTTTGFLGTHWGPVAATTANVSSTATINGNLVAASGTLSTNTTTGALVVTGGVGIAGNINIDGSAGNAVVTTANIAASNMNVTGGFYVNGSLINSYVAPNFVQTANVSLYSSTAAYTTGTFYPTFSNIAGGNTQIGVNSSYTFNATSGNLTAIGFVGTHWGPVAATTANVSSTLTVTGNTAVNNTLYAQGVFDNSVRVVSTSSGTGNLTITGSSIALTTTGGAGTYGSATQVPVFTTDAYGRVISTTNTAITFPAAPNFVQTANVSLYSSSAAYTTGTFYPTFSNIAGGNTQIGVSTALTYNATSGNLTTTGFLGTHWGAVAATTANVSSTATINGNLVAAATTVSTNITSGALVVTGGVGIAGNINIGGSAGNAVVTTANIAASNMNVTGGFYVNGSLLTSGSGTQNFVQTANVSLYEQVSAYTTGTFFPMFSNTVTNQGNTTTGVASGFTYNAGTGNLTTAGFVGTTWGAVAAITANVSGVATINGNLVAAATTSSISSTTGALVVNGGVGIGGRTFIGGNTVIANTTQSTSTTSGALVVSGGVGIAGNTYISGNLFVSNLINGSETIRTDSFLQSLNPVVAPLNQLNKGLGSLFFASSFVSTGTSSLTHFAVHPTGSYLYVSNPTTNTVSQYNIDRTTGNLTTIFTAMPTGTGPSSVVVNSNGRYVYVANDTAATISHFSVDQITGNLSLASAAIAAGASARQLAIDPLNRWLYSADAVSSAIIVFSINSTTGVLSNVGATSAAAGPQSLGIDLTGRFLYAGQSLNLGILQFRINQTNGTLTSNSFGSASGNPTAFAFDKSGKFVYVANSNFIDSHILDQTTGSLSFTGNRLSTNGTTGIAVDPAGRFLYFINSTDNLFVVNAINPVTGNITTIQSLSISSGSAARQGVAIDPTGRFVYGLTTANVVSQYAAHNLSAGAALVNANLYIAGNTISSSATTGALVITGGVGVGGNINVTGSFGNAIVATGNIAATNIAVNGGFYVNGSLVRSYVEPNFVQTANVSLFEQVSAYTTGTFYPMFSNTVVNSANTTTGVNTALTYNATNGNLAAAGLVGVHWGPVAATTANVSGTLTVSGNTAINNNLYAYQVFSGGAAVITALPNFVQTANVSLYSSTAAYTTGTFYPTFSNIAGGNTQIGVSSGFTFNAATGNLAAAGFVGTHWGALAATTANVSGTLTVSGNTAINNNLYAYQVFSGGAAVITALPNFVQTANVSLYEQVAAYTTGTFYPMFSNTVVNAANTTTGVNTGLTYNATTGNLISSAGLVSTTLWGAVAATTANVSAATISVSTSTGALVVAGGVGIAGATFIGGNTVIANTTTSTSTTSGALVVSGGVGIAGRLNVSSNVVISSASSSNSKTTGALVITGSGGIGLGGGRITTTDIVADAMYNGGQTGVGGVATGLFQNYGTAIFNFAGANVAYRDPATFPRYSSIIVSSDGNDQSPISGNISTIFFSAPQQFNYGGNGAAISNHFGNIKFNTRINAFLNGPSGQTIDVGTETLILGNTQVSIPLATISTSTNSGALVVSGGAGIGANVNVGGNVAANNSVRINSLTSATKSVSMQYNTVSDSLDFIFT